MLAMYIYSLNVQLFNKKQISFTGNEPEGRQSCSHHSILLMFVQKLRVLWVLRVRYVSVTFPTQIWFLGRCDASGVTSQLPLRGDHGRLHVLPDPLCSISLGEQAAGETQVQLNLGAGPTGAFSLFQLEIGHAVRMTMSAVPEAFLWRCLHDPWVQCRSWLWRGPDPAGCCSCVAEPTVLIKPLK